MGSLFGDKPKSPDPINPQAVGKAQLNFNKQSIAQQSAANRLNQTDGFGNTLNFSQTGTDSYGNPIYSASQSLGQAGQQYAGGLANLGQQYFQTAGQGAPDSMAGFDRAMSFYDESQQPYVDRRANALDSRLANQGITMGSEAYSNATNDLRASEAQARNNFISGAQNQFYGQGLQNRQQQMSELSPGINAAGTFLNPSYVNAPSVSAPGVDMTSLYGLRQQGLNTQYQADMQNQGGLLSGLASIGGSLLMAPMTGGGSVAGGLMGSFFGK